MYKFHYAKIALILVVTTLFFSSCLDDTIKQKQDEANSKMQVYLDANGYTQDDHIGYGVYVKVIDDSEATGQLPVYGDAIIFNYTGKLTSGKVYESTDSSYAGSFASGGSYIYGHTKRWIGNLMLGFDTAVRTISPGTKAQFVIPHDMAFGDYEPVVYDVELIDIVKDDSTYERKLFDEFKEANDFDDSTYIAQGLLYKFISDTIMRDSVVLRTNDTLTVKLKGRFAESYYDDGKGRQFFPLEGESGINEEYIFGSANNYPKLPAIDSALKYMRVGEKMEIAFLSGAQKPTGQTQWGYGINSVINPKLNYVIILPYTPLHYEIELVKSSRE